MGTVSWAVFDFVKSGFWWSPFPKRTELAGEKRFCPLIAMVTKGVNGRIWGSREIDQSLLKREHVKTAIAHRQHGFYGPAAFDQCDCGQIRRRATGTESKALSSEPWCLRSRSNPRGDCAIGESACLEFFSPTMLLAAQFDGVVRLWNRASPGQSATPRVAKRVAATV
jgi:hypothetical protein